MKLKVLQVSKRLDSTLGDLLLSTNTSIQVSGLRVQVVPIRWALVLSELTWLPNDIQI